MYEYVCIMKFRVDVTSPRLQLELSNNQAEENIHCFRESLNRQCDFLRLFFVSIIVCTIIPHFLFHYTDKLGKKISLVRYSLYVFPHNTIVKFIWMCPVF